MSYVCIKPSIWTQNNKNNYNKNNKIFIQMKKLNNVFLNQLYCLNEQIYLILVICWVQTYFNLYAMRAVQCIVYFVANSYLLILVICRLWLKFKIIFKIRCYNTIISLLHDIQVIRSISVFLTLKQKLSYACDGNLNVHR